MSSSPSFVRHVLDLLEPVGPVRSRAMMGGHIVLCGELTFALIDDDRLYLKVDDLTKPVFAKAGGEPFVYEMHGKRTEMSYWTPPDATLDDPDTMRSWALLALEASARSKKPARAKKVVKAKAKRVSKKR